MPNRKSSLTPAIFAIFLIPIFIPVFFALIVSPWTNRARAQDQAVGTKRPELPHTRPAPAPMRSGSFPRPHADARTTEKLGESDRNGAMQRPSSKVGVLLGSSLPRTTATPTPSRNPRATANTALQKVPQFQQTARETPQQPVTPTPHDFVGTEQRSQEVRRALEPRQVSTPDPVPEPIVVIVGEIEDVPNDSRPSSEPEIEVRPIPAPKLAETDLHPSPFEESAQGVTNAHFEEIFDEEEMPDASAPQEILADKSPDQEFFGDAVAQNKSDQPNAVVPVIPVPSTGNASAVTQQSPNQTATKPAWLASLRPVSSIDVREAIQVPPIAAGDSANVLQPTDQANAYLSRRQSVSFAESYWTPWRADRDSYPFCHYPLYFEDPNLERCGRGWSCLTTFVSCGRFYANIPFLPYRTTAEPHLCRIRTLPDCPACHQFGWDAYLPPWSWKAAAVQTGAYFGTIYIVP